MKKLSPVWFLRSPIDVEEKYYVLLDFLKSVNQEIKNKNFYSPLKKVLSLSVELDHFLKHRTLKNLLDPDLTQEEFDLLEFYLDGKFTPEEEKELDRILKNSLRLLSKYEKTGINLIKSIEDQIKIYNLKTSEGKNESGIAIFRSMSTNEIFTYWWKKTEIQLDKDFKKGIMMKNIFIPHNYFSMSYEFIMCEILVAAGINSTEKLPCVIIEISETFNQGSEIFKIAKEKFLKEIDPD